jgi:hypothetical protein
MVRRRTTISSIVEKKDRPLNDPFLEKHRPLVAFGKWNAGELNSFAS